MVNIYKKILLAVDNSSNSSRAIDKVIDLQKSWDSKVVMFHSIKHPIKPLLPNFALLSSSGTYYVSERKLLNEYKEGGNKLLQSYQELFINEQLTVETRLITDEAPEEYIEKKVKEEGFDLVVIGTKGIHSKLRQILLGSVAKRVVKNAPCDVLIVR